MSQSRTVICIECSHLRIAGGTPFCQLCDRTVTPGNILVRREHHAQVDGCVSALALTCATGDELMRVERFMHGYV
jgi:hypothetical protein